MSLRTEGKNTMASTTHAAGGIASLDELYATLGAHDLAALWTMKGALTPEPVTRMAPHLWRWDHVRALMARAGDLVSAEDAERRVLAYRNPGTADHELARTTDTLWAAVQMVLPGEVAPVHRHTAAALRFIIEGSHGYTIVDGERHDMEVGDVVLTPAWTWHEHGNAGDGPMIWLDGLDLPVVAALHAVFTERGGEAGGPPAGAARILSFRYADAIGALHARRNEPGDPYDDLVHEYRDPTTGAPALPTMSASLQLLRAGTHTRAHRHTSSVVYHVAEGSGHSVVDGTRLDWGRGDTFAVPVWAAHEHANDSGEDAVLFSFSDGPVLDALGLQRTQDA
jgi:gentisate 1,2-dioxygenase